MTMPCALQPSESPTNPGYDKLSNLPRNQKFVKNSLGEAQTSSTSATHLLDDYHFPDNPGVRGSTVLSAFPKNYLKLQVSGTGL